MGSLTIRPTIPWRNAPKKPVPTYREGDGNGEEAEWILISADDDFYEEYRLYTTGDIS